MAPEATSASAPPISQRPPAAAGRTNVHALTAAIERWSANQASRRRAAFVYRGADLRHAAERLMYFVLVNDPVVMAAFEPDAADDAIEAAGSRSPICSLLVCDRLGGQSNRSRLASLVPRNTGILSQIRTMITRSEAADAAGPAVAAISSHAPAGRAANIAFMVIQPKFVRYFATITERLDRSFAFLTIDDPATEAYLDEQKLPHIALRCAPEPKTAVRPVLRKFDSLCLTYDAIFAFLERQRPQVFVVPEGNAPIYEILRVAAKAVGVPTICIQQGWSPIAHPGFRNLTFDDMLVWGQRFAELLAPHNPQQKFSITGNPNISDAGTRQPGPISGIGFFLQKGGPFIRKAEWHAFLDLIDWTARSYADIDVIIRDHPSSPPLDDDELARVGSHPNIRRMPPSDWPLDDVLSRCDVVVSAYSTTLLEALVPKAIPLIFGASGIGNYHPDIVADGAAVQAASLDTAKQELAALVDDPQLRARLRRSGEILKPQFFAATGDAAAARIADTIVAWADRSGRASIA